MRVVNLANLQQFTAVNLTSDPGYDAGNRVIPQCVQVKLAWGTGSGNVALNILHGRYSGAYSGTQAQANTILAGLNTGGAWTALASHLAPTVALSAVTLRDLGIANAPEVASNGPGGVGTAAGTELPDEVAAVVTLRTALTGPANRGRIYVPGWATSALGANNTIAAAAVTDLAAWAATITGVLAGVGFTFSLGHFSRVAYIGSAGANHPARPAGTVPITSTEVRDNHWDTQRRRGLK
jgi:hypothetical protein